jgi:hypothetical protein
MNHRRNVRYLAAHPSKFAAIESAHDSRLLDAHLDEPDMDSDEVVPVQEFEVGERVVCHTYTGTVVEYVAQVYADNLYRIRWDTAPEDTDLYPAHGLSRLVGEQAA